ncbi:hypothetical protein ACFWBF_11775 [Streptomyces sp. NPDC060028]|uniref:hypothetical protein n=1 Tax=Streptomyces sp. NPDC060028 TaxID=3347041 RepID=UPI0036BBA981
MDEQGGAGGVPPHDGHGSPRAGQRIPRGDEERTAAADTDEASRLDRPGAAPDPGNGRRRWVSPKEGGASEQRGGGHG